MPPIWAWSIYGHGPYAFLTPLKDARNGAFMGRTDGYRGEEARQGCLGEAYLIGQWSNRRRTEEARIKAEATEDKGARDALLQVADTWERMAKCEDVNNPPKPD